MDRLDGWVSKVCDFERGDSCLCPVSNCGHYFILTKFFVLFSLQTIAQH